MTTIINYNLGNPKSIQNMLRFLGFDAHVSSDPLLIAESERIILPGVGHFDYGMQQLEKLGLVDILKEEIIDKKKPILGICLGMQLLTKFSEEGNKIGLGFIDAQTKKFNFEDSILKIPHMGWNTVNFVKDSVLTQDVSSNPRYYFVHSYYVECVNKEDVICTTDYGQSFVSGFQAGKIFGLQFHPEKSHKFGMELLVNFCKIK